MTDSEGSDDELVKNYCDFCSYTASPDYNDIREHEAKHLTCPKCSRNTNVYNGPYLFYEQEYNINSICGIFVQYEDEFLDILGADARMCCGCFEISHWNGPICCWNKIGDYPADYERAAEHSCSFCFEEIPKLQKGVSISFRILGKMQVSKTKFIKPQGCERCWRYINVLRESEKLLIDGKWLYGLDESELQYESRIHVNVPLFGHFETHLCRYVTRYYDDVSKKFFKIDFRINNLIALLRHVSTIEFSDMDELYKRVVAEHKRYIDWSNYKIRMMPKSFTVAFVEEIKRISNQTAEEYVKDQLKILNVGIERNLMETKKLLDVVIPPLREIVMEYVDCRYIFSRMINNSQKS
ncbi:MAG: hypothetical protein Hyperionvirus1_93 [Hyperionvirus sp.]|uniref:Uncharacterized protein n=1 Tax=Hyperionvirus sp. TaxID=2487770 RepID=A0A3G5A7M9_9VIRU|nr:MAG: hypothetical protein Hyperionvirus1_93 [Hyperionvirus sp.]